MATGRNGMRWDRRFLASTRGRIVGLLRRRGGTVDELARSLDLTDNAVRAHLATLERDGLVEQRGLRRGRSKPSYAYELTPEAEQLFSRAYAPLLDELLSVLQERYGSEAATDLLRTVGQRLAQPLPPDAGIEARLEQAAAVLNELGGLAEASVEGETLQVQGYSCPLAALTARHPEVCQAAAMLVSEIIGLPMRECCERPADERPRCCFEGRISAA